MREILLSLPGREISYRVLLEAGLRLKLGPLLKPLDPPRRLFLISDTKVAGLYGREVQKALTDSGFEPVLLTTPPGERAKRWTVVQRLARELLRLGGHRHSWLLALGGGVVGDLTGFLASIFMRGIPCVQVPTTLLAMVDAALGGKTAINLPEGKNLLGTFHQPCLVVIDPEFLHTLPGRERRNGLAEVLKAAFIGDPDLLLKLKEARDRMFRDREELADIIYRAAALKARVVAQDEREAGLRRILNFGHTLGHALEQASGFRVPHGQAVAWGMAAALVLSERLAGLPREEKERGRRLLRDLGLTLRAPALDLQAVLAALPLDKKRREEKLVFVLLRRLGEPVILEGVPLGPVAEALQEVMFGPGPGLA